MAKAVLVMDMPDDCPLCKFFDLDGQCHAVDAENPWSTDPDKAKPDWCPLRELPDGKEELPFEKYEFGGLGKAFTSGWNACLDKILKERKE